MIPVRRLKGQQPQLWQIQAEPPPWVPVWMICGTGGSGLCRVQGAATVPAPLLLSTRPPPLQQGLSSWQLSSCDPLSVPLIRIPPAAEPAVNQFPLPNGQLDLPSRPHVLGFQPSASVELVPVFPRVYRTVLHPHLRKGWLEKRRLPEYKVYLNNTLALETTWFAPEEIGIFQRQEKPVLVTNQMARRISRPAAASRNLHTLLVSPRRIAGCPVAIKRMRSSNKRMALAAAMMAMDSDVAQRPSASSAHPLHLLSASSALPLHFPSSSSALPLHLLSSPLKIPLLTAHRPGVCSPWEGFLGPVVPAHLSRVSSLSAPGVALMAGDWRERGPAGENKARRKPPCGGALVLHADQKMEDETLGLEQQPFKLGLEEQRAPNVQRPVASTPVPGSPWCVVWTGDDRVFFFNPTMQLSVWEQPMDLKDRGDLKRIMEDPPHKRKKDSLSTSYISPCLCFVIEDGSTSLSADDDDEHNSKAKRNKVEGPGESGLNGIGKESRTLNGTSQSHMILPLELRKAHFRDMLLERGVSAFSTWEKELHKIVFDPRYLLLGSEERKQIFDQFAKERMEEEYKERKSRLQQAKEEYRKLLEESKITSRSTFKEFSEKCSRDQRFKQVLKQKDQEHLYSQFVNALKKRDKENRIRLRKTR
ncbi:transcription elongation regulator 1-like protein [Engraulis encrasicolus]|uniref:transcription elongation regulator 1-like protein n=1 Tax=Engraulis encrasicolus TaxID=184585 RepID=UPI002FD3AD8E